MPFSLGLLKPSFTLLPALAINLLLTGCSALDPQANFKSLMLQATGATTPVRSAPTIENNGGNSKLVIEINLRDLNLTAQDKEALAANLAIGEAAEIPSFVDDTRTEIDFVVPNAGITLWVSHDDKPGVIAVNQYDGPIGGMNTKVISKEYYELTDEANTFARNWLAAKPQ